MKLTFYSNYINHHQIPLCNAFASILGDDYKFVAMEAVPQEKINLGYPEEKEASGYYIPSFRNSDLQEYAYTLSNDSDVVIIGDAPDKYIRKRLKEEKITFRYKERIIKNGLNIKTLPRIIIGTFRHFTIFQRKPMYILCASGYTPCDINRFSDFSNRYYRWGYFPETKKYDVQSLMEKKKHNKKVSILWVARLINLKKPQDILQVAIRLKELDVPFELNIIGTGHLENELHRIIEDNHIDDCCHLLGAKPQSEVRDYMEKANIFAFTSNFEEGWGAVLNEAMNSGCAVVASHSIGSVPFLIKHEKNGLIYKYGDNETLFNNILRLTKDEMLRNELGINAYETIVNTWNAENAAARFVNLCNCIKQGKESPYEDGPCSPAPIIREEDMYNYIITNSK